MKKFAFLFLYFLAPVLLCAVVFLSNPSMFGMPQYLVPMSTGVFAYTWFNIQLILSAKPKFIEVHFGLDRFYMFHGIMGIVAIVLAFSHKMIKESIYGEGGLTQQFGNLGLNLFIFLAILAILFMSGTLARMSRVWAKVQNFSKKKLFGRYSVQKMVHNANVLANILIFIHVIRTYSATNLLVKSMYILYFGVSMGFYVYAKILKPIFVMKPFRIKEVIKESDLVYTIVLTPEGKENRVFSYHPGQFLYVQFKSKGLSGELHPFSISSNPENNRDLRISVKQLGDWTNQIHQLKPGDLAKVDAAYGRFSADFVDKRKTVILLAGGIGITPMMSMLRSFYQTDKLQKVILFWGVRNREELMWKEEIARMQKEMPNFTFVPVLEKDARDEEEEGFITKETISRTLQKKKMEIEQPHYFVCGPPVMMHSVIASLKQMRVQKRHIHFERFSM